MNQIKCSQSMSSLHVSPCQQQFDEGTFANFSSKTPKPRHTFDKMWRRSWGCNNEDEEMMDLSVQDQGDQGEEEDERMKTSLAEFLQEYTDVCDSINDIQVQRGRLADPDKLSQLASEFMEKQMLRRQINEAADLLMQEYPPLKKECMWKMRHLNSQWDALEKILQTPPSESSNIPKQNKNDEVQGIDWLREWLSEMENQLQPLDFRAQWTPSLLNRQTLKHKGLQLEIDEKTPQVHETLREYPQSAKRSRLETRWCQLRLRVVEWVQHLHNVQIKKVNEPLVRRETVHPSSEDETAEPLKKYRRLGDQTEGHFDDEAIMGQSHDADFNRDQEVKCGSNNSLSSDGSQGSLKRKFDNISTYHFKHEDLFNESQQDPIPPEVLEACQGDALLMSSSALSETEEAERECEQCDEISKDAKEFEIENKSLLENIDELVQEAEFLIKKSGMDGGGFRVKRRRTKRAARCSPLSLSCDASGESESESQPTAYSLCSVRRKSLEKVVVMRRKKKRQRPKSWTTEHFKVSSDTALNLLGGWLAQSGGGSSSVAGGKRRRRKRMPPQFNVDAVDLDSYSLSSDMQQHHPLTSATEQDWDSYQEKYLSEPYSEEMFDPNDTLKLAFGEDYGECLSDPDVDFPNVFNNDKQTNNSTNKNHCNKQIINEPPQEVPQRLFLSSSPIPHSSPDPPPPPFSSSSSMLLMQQCSELKSAFGDVHSHLRMLDPFDACDLSSLEGKIDQVRKILETLSDRKDNLQGINNTSSVRSGLRDEIQELYALYEENFELGTYLLKKMLSLQSMWERFEAEKYEFERAFSCTDSGRGTDLSDSEVDWVEKKKEFENLKNRAGEIKNFIRSGSVLDIIQMRVEEAENILEQNLRKRPKVVYPNRRKSPAKRPAMKTGQVQQKYRKWRTVRRMVVFNFTLMGIFLAAAYFLHPKCCEYSNTFCFSLIPHLTHETLPPI